MKRNNFKQIVWQRLIVVNIVHVDSKEDARATDVSAKVRAVPHTWNACTINASQVIQQPACPTHTNVPVNAFVRGTMTVPESGVRMPIPCVLRRKSIHGSVPVRPRVHSTATAPITSAPFGITILRSVTPDPVDVDATVELTVTVLATPAVRQGNLLSAWRCPARMLVCVSVRLIWNRGGGWALIKQISLRFSFFFSSIHKSRSQLAHFGLVPSF